MTGKATEPSLSPDCGQGPESSLGHRFASGSHCPVSNPSHLGGPQRGWLWGNPYSPDTGGVWTRDRVILEAYQFGL